MTREKAVYAGRVACARYLADEACPAWETARSQRGALLALRRQMEELERMTASRRQVPSAAEWLLDNFSVYQSRALLAIEDFQQGTRLPACSDRGDRLRVILLAEQAVETASDSDGCLAFFEGVQEAAPLSEAECALLGSALLLGMLPVLGRLCTQVQEADWWQGEALAALAEKLRQTFALFHGLAAPEFARHLAKLSAAERMLRQDPAGLYPNLAEESRSACRAALARTAKRKRVRERDYAEELLARARREGRSVAELLFPPPGAGAWYPLTVAGGSVVLALLAQILLGRWWSGLLLVLPLLELVKQGLDFLLLRWVPVRPLLRLALEDGVPAEGRTLCVIPALLTGGEAGERLAQKLEYHALVSKRAGKEIRYGILADLPDAPFGEDELRRGWVANAKQAVAALNSRYGGGFYLFYREPTYARRDNCWRGWERKRGALLELARFLRKLPSGIRVLEGEEGDLTGTRFPLTLDEDTRLLPDTAERLIATMLCPLNRPRLDETRRVVQSGYGILQPAVGIALEAEGTTAFARLHSGQGGAEPYAFASSELYRDVFDRGSYTGKGLIDIDAFLTCLDHRFPEGCILSHDLLEGEYLHTGLAGDCPVLDSAPQTALAWYRRLHRWTRGDWQTLPWLRKTVRNEFAQRVENPLSDLSKWKILDNLRRSLVPVALVLALTLGACGRGPVFWTDAVLALLVSVEGVLLHGLARFLGRGKRGTARFRTKTISGLTGAIKVAAARFLLLPCEAWAQLWAALTALIRMGITQRGLLDWTVSASTEDTAGVWAVWHRLLPASGLGLAVLVLGQNAAGKLLGVLWLLSPLLAWYLSRPEEAVKLSEGDRAFLREEAGDLWRYFDTFLTPADHFLPPDNVQERPAAGVAHRTSPTNMGLSLTACLAALDLELTERERALLLIERQLTAMEGLERCHGHFYNWYDTRKAEPLYPRYLSTVDSGNLCAALIALTQGLQELGETELARRARHLAEEMDFAFLYDEGQHLFYIGYDAEGGGYTNSWYDLMCSEARTASYIAIARGEVEGRHWRYLSRALLRSGRYAGMASWSGTAFEYLMPQLFLPAPRGSLLRETLAFCVAEQYRARGWQKGVWGVSESAFFALNGDGSYCYQANGTPSLALKRETGRRVVAPYASALALTVTPRLAAQNLRRLDELGMNGQYGFYDALDLTVPGGAVVPTWMVHHQGMSLLAIDNALHQNIFVRRFLREPAMAAFAPLLGETLPAGPAMRRREEPMRKTKAPPVAPFSRGGTGFDPVQPAAHLYSDGSFHSLLTAEGGGWCAFAGKRVTGDAGVLNVTARLDGKEYAVFPCGQADSRLEWRFEEERATLSLTGDAFQVRQEVALWSGLNGSRHTLWMENRSASPMTVRCTLQPILLEEDAYAAHPAFARLSVESEPRPHGVLFRRRPREGREALCLAALWDGPVARWDTARIHADRPAGHTGAVCDPQLTLELEIPGKGTGRLVLALSVGEEGQALRNAEGILGGLKAPQPSFALQLAERCGLSPRERQEADRLLSHLLHWRTKRAGEGIQGPQDLWPFGLSGDLPIAVTEAGGNDARRLARFAAEHELLVRCGYPFDLVILDRSGALEEPLCGKLRRRHIPATFGGSGGLHLISAAPEQWAPIYAGAAVVLQNEVPRLPAEVALPLAEGAPLPPQGGDCWWEWLEDGFRLSLNNALPPRRWSHILANENFGWLTDECGTGHLWYGNARENQLLPWENDPLAQQGPEDLLLLAEGEEVSCFARRDGWETVVCYRAATASWQKRRGGKEISLTAELPLGENCRTFRLTVSGFQTQVQLCWMLWPQLAERRRDARFVRMRQKDGGIALTNGANQDFPGVELLLRAEGCPLEPELLPDGEICLSCPVSGSLLLTTSIITLWQNTGTPPLLKPDYDWPQLASPLRLETPDGALNHYLSFWCLYQVVACRLLARTSLYQCGGAFGFRDQLQDVCALIPTAPELARQQILRAAAHQFREGDVQHWWHPSGTAEPERGVRTRISDDLLWLPYALACWVETTGDTDLLNERVGWRTSEPLRPQEQERYEMPARDGEASTLYEHGCAAIHCVITRGTGAHGLLLMGGGDWNDGLNRIGAEGKGESVWLTWFAALVLERWSAVAEGQRDTARSIRCARRTQELAQAANRAWDGHWYLRGYDDGGRPFGGAGHPFCQTDSIAQSFSVFAPNPQPERGREAVLRAVSALHDTDRGTVALLRGGFQPGSGAGYIQSYPPGVRENGGQYTHGAVWLARACYRLGERELGWRLLRDLLPERHDSGVYEGEPYVLAGDVSTASGQAGHCGWSWYTGAAAWYYRTAAEEMLGIRLRGGRLYLNPQLPEGWDGYRATLRLAGKTLRIRVHCAGPCQILVDGVPKENGLAPDSLGGQAELTVFCGKNAGQ
ncbi:MAG: hypothetical protein LUE61_10535 [Clostridiales bacterium]|nr:hypothetical protein [Clostridiales bacterium]